VRGVGEGDREIERDTDRCRYIYIYSPNTNTNTNTNFLKHSQEPLLSGKCDGCKRHLTNSPGSGGLTDEALEMLIKERSKLGGFGKGKGVAESGHEREDKTVEQKVMRWDNNCEGWLHVGSAIKQLLECNSNSFDRCFASRTLSKICSRQHHCGTLVCTPTMLSSVCSCLEDTCSSFTANERAIGSSTDSGDVAGGGASVDSGSGKDKEKNLHARKGSDDGGRGSRDREWWEATASSDIGLVQGLNQQCILHCAYILFCCSRTVSPCSA